jgi:hypothetical protein
MAHATDTLEARLTRDRSPAVPLYPFRPIAYLFLDPVDSDLRAFLEEAHALIQGCPPLVEAVERDLDAHALRKKAVRAADAQWLAAQTLRLPGMPAPAPEPDHASVLQQGRPRTPGYVVLNALLLRGYFGAGFKSCDVATMMQESITLRVFFQNLGMSLPGCSTLTELVNAVSNETRLLILDAQTARVLGLGWDDFTVMLQDSTHVEGNTAWPTDSRLLVALTARLVRVGAALPKLGLPVIDLPLVRRHLGVMTTLDREIDMMQGKRGQSRTRQRRYGKLLWRARRVHRMLDKAVGHIESVLPALDVLPSRKAMAARAVDRLRSDVEALAQVIATCTARVIDDQKVPMAEKKLSVSDPDAGFIAKGQREPVIGYKPQLARSGAGFVVGLRLPKGNAADSDQLVPMVDEVTVRTGVTPTTVSVDDGYASRANMDALKQRGIEVISINGAKGRALTARADWNSDEYALARDQRSAVESLMFSLKQGFDFGVVARRGLAAAHADLLEKALAYNTCHMVRVRARLAAHSGADPDEPFYQHAG